MEEEDDCDENLESFPLSTWSHDCGLKALSCVSLHGSETKRFFMGHKRWSSSQISTIARCNKIEGRTIYKKNAAPSGHKSPT